jgi:hypothetical protein
MGPCSACLKPGETPEDDDRRYVAPKLVNIAQSVVLTLVAALKRIAENTFGQCLNLRAGHINAKRLEQFLGFSLLHHVPGVD